MNLKLVRENKIVFLCFFISTIFLLKNLGNVYFWTDEANSALVSRNILTYGYPSNFGEKNIVQHYWDYDGELKLAPFYRTTTWLHLYVAALSFKLFGATTFAARFPFAIIGLIIIICLFAILRKHTQDKFIINTSIILLTFCIPFYLHMRQCRYYSMATLFTLLGAWEYLEFYEKGAKKKFILYSVLLFLSMHSAFLILMMAIGVHFLIFYKRDRIKDLLVSWGIMALVVLPVTYFLRLWERPLDLLGHEQGFNLNGVILRFLKYITYLNNYLIPAALLLVYVIWRLIRRELTFKSFKDNQLISFSIVLVMVATTFLSIVAPHNFRFIVAYIPLIMVGLAYILAFFKERTNKFVVSLIIIILISSNVIHQAPYFLTKIPILAGSDIKIGGRDMNWYSYKMRSYFKPESLLYNFLYEITHDFDGPNEGISKYLNEHADKDDVVKATYGDFMYQFYTDLKVIHRGEFNNEIEPDWYIFRDGWWQWRADAKISKYRELLDEKYEEIELDYPETSWENLPEPDYHLYKTATGYPKVKIYRRKKQYKNVR